MRRLAAGLLPVVVLVLAGCTAGGSGDETEQGGNSVDDPVGEVVAVEGAVGEPTAEIPVISTEENMLAYGALPLDAYSLRLDHRLVDQAQDKLVAECVAEMGFDMGPYRQAFPDPGPRRPRLAQLYGVGVMAEAQQYGYDTPPKYAGPTQPPVPPPMSEALDIALNGPVEDRPALEPLEYGPGTVQFSGFTPDSCVGQAFAALEINDSRQIGTPDGSLLVSNLVPNTFLAAAADSRVVAADGSWSACMKDKGFDVPSPDESANIYSQLGRDASIPAATADVECKYATNYFGVRYGVETAYQKAAIEENFQELEAIAAANRVILERAEAILNE